MVSHKGILSLRKPTRASFSRVKGFNKEEVNKYFYLLESLYDKYKYPANLYITGMRQDCLWYKASFFYICLLLNGLDKIPLQIIELSVQQIIETKVLNTELSIN